MKFESFSKLLCEESLLPDEIDGESVTFDVADYISSAALARAVGSIKNLGTVAEVKSAVEDAGIGPDSSEAEIRVFVRRCWNGKADKTARERVAEAISNCAKLTKPDVKKMFSDLDDEDKAEAIAEAKAEAEEDFEKRSAGERDLFIPLDEETPKSIAKAAKKSLPKGYFVRDGWIWKINYEEPEKPIPVSTVFKVAGISYEKGGTDIQVTIRFQHRSKDRVGIVERTFPLADTLRDSNALVATLFGDGFVINPVGGVSKEAGTNAIADLSHILRSIQTDREAQIADKAGFTEDKTAWISTTGEVVGDGPEYVLNPAMKVERPEKGGTEDGWQENFDFVVSKTNGDIILAGGLSGFTGTYLDYIDYPNSLILSFEGDSSTGKTTAQGYGVSVQTTPGNGGLMVSADATAAAAENYAVRANSAVLALDNGGTGKIDPAEKQRMILVWAEGQGRGRGTRDAGVQERKGWCTCFTISDEVGYVAALEAAKLKDSTAVVRAGSVARVIAISMQDAVDLNSLEDGAEIIARYDAMVRNPTNYGWAGPKFAKALLDMGVDAAKAKHEDAVKRLVEARKKRADKANKGKLEAQKERDHYSSTEMRVVRAMALLIAAGEIAVESGIIGDIEVFDMMENLMLKSIARRAKHLNVSEQTLEALKGAMVRALHQGRVTDVFSDDTHPSGFVAYYGHPGDNGKKDQKASTADVLSKRTYYLPEKYLTELGYHGSAATLAKLVDDAGYLIRPADESKLTHGYMPFEGSTKHVRFKGEFLHGKESDN